MLWVPTRSLDFSKGRMGVEVGAGEGNPGQAVVWLSIVSALQGGLKKSSSRSSLEGHSLALSRWSHLLQGAASPPWISVLIWGMGISFLWNLLFLYSKVTAGVGQ